MAVVMTRVKPSMLPPTIITAPTSEMARPKEAISTVSKAKRSSQASSRLRSQTPAPSDWICSPCLSCASCTAWQVSAVTTGNTSSPCASTIALKLNSQPRNPKGPERDSNRYTTRPITTEGTANMVLSKVSSTGRMAKRATPRPAPSTSPALQASAQAVALTSRERPTMANRPASNARMSCSAVAALSVNEFMSWGIVATHPNTHHMNHRA